MSIILNIDSSGPVSSVSIAQEGLMLQHLTNENQKDHAAFLHVGIQKLLKSTNISADSLNAIAVAAGPGSYTGIRVGFAAAKGLSYALNKPLISISTTEIMAKSAVTRNQFLPGWYCPMIDARRNEVYTALYNANAKEFIAPHAMIVTEASLQKFFFEGTTYIFGSGAEKCKKILSARDKVFVAERDIFSGLAVLSFERFIKKNFNDTAYTAPLYGKEFYNG